MSNCTSCDDKKGVRSDHEPEWKTWEEDDDIDMVNYPKHYEILPDLQAIDVIQAMLTKIYGDNGFKAYCHGSMLKYLLREKIVPEQDVEKAVKFGKFYKEE